MITAEWLWASGWLTFWAWEDHRTLSISVTSLWWATAGSVLLFGSQWSDAHVILFAGLSGLMLLLFGLSQAVPALGQFGGGDVWVVLLTFLWWPTHPTAAWDLLGPWILLWVLTIGWEVLWLLAAALRHRTRPPVFPFVHRWALSWWLLSGLGWLAHLH